MKHLPFLTFFLLLAACGFTPMYGSGAGSLGVSATAGLDQVDIALIPDESGVYLRNLLIDQFYQDGYPSSPTHSLQITDLEETESGLDITVDSETTRKQIRISAKVELIDHETGGIVLDRDMSALTSYNVLGSQFATRVSERDAREAALGDLARQIETQVALYFKR